MIIRNWHIGEVVSFSVAHCATIESPLDFLHSVINIKPLTANADNHSFLALYSL